ncbi:MAG: NAD(P)H-binding protein [Chloroflexales bacterium]|nr:NAD(P)H-binding protein [Chloroflexales bacterium]
MNIVIAGARGRTAKELIKLLVSRGDTVTGIIRQDRQRGEIEALRATAVVADLARDDLTTFVKGMDAVVFAAAGAAHEYEAIDHRAADRLAAAAEQAGVRRYILLSANGAHDPHSWGAAYADYLGAKRAGEDCVKSRDLDWTVMRPAALGSGEGTGHITLLSTPGGTGSIDRKDVARTLVAVLDHDNTIGKTLELWRGNTPIEEAARAV